MRAHVRRRIAATASAILIGPHAPAFPDGPWESGQGAGGSFVTDADGRTRYAWPPVPDDYIQSAPLGEIADWLARAWSERATANNWNPKRSEDGMVVKVMTRCFVNPASLKLEPLTPVQWNTLAHRAAGGINDSDLHTSDGAMRMVRHMDGFPITDAEWPLDGFRMLARELILHCTESGPDQSQQLTRLTTGFAIRSGDTAFLRLVMDRMRRTHDARPRVNLGELAAVCVPHEHDLNPTEAAIAAGELLALAEAFPGQPQQAGIALAALSVGGNASLRLMEEALTSGDAGIRRAAVRWTAEQARISRFKKDLRTERRTREQSDRIIAMIRDPDEQVAATALHAIITIPENEPEQLAAALMNGLGTRPIPVDIMACYALARMPRQARPAPDALLQLAASPDPDLRIAAEEAVRAVNRSSRSPAQGPPG